MGKLGLVEKVATWEDFYICNRKDASLEQMSLSVGTWIDNVDLSTQRESLLESSLATNCFWPSYSRLVQQSGFTPAKDERNIALSSLSSSEETVLSILLKV